MKFTANKEELLKALTPLTKVAPKVASMPILETVLFEVNGEHLILTATDLEVMLRSRIEVRVNPDKSGNEVRVCADLKLIHGFLKLSDKSDVIVEFDVNEAFVIHAQVGKSQCAISGFNGNEFPVMETLQGNERPVCSFETLPLQTGLGKVLYATGNDDLRPALMGVNLKTDKGFAKICSTDAHSLSLYKLECDGESVDITIPKKAVGILSDASMAKTERISLFKSGHNYCALLGSFMLYFRVVDAKFPNYEAVIPQENAVVATVSREALLSGVKRVGLFSNVMTSQVSMDFSVNALGDFISLKASDVDSGKGANEGVDCKIEGDGLVIGFNAKKLQEALSNIDGDVVRFEMSSPSRAALMYGATDVHMSLLMPVMLS